MKNFDITSVKFNDQGLVSVIAQDAETLEVLMLAWMNAESLQETLEKGQMTYWSRSRQAFWRKGESSGHIQSLIDMRIDCDRDCLLAMVKQVGPACHTNRRSCFYTALRAGEEIELSQPEG